MCKRLLAEVALVCCITYSSIWMIVRGESVVSRAPSVYVDVPPTAVWSKKVYMVRKQDLELRCSTRQNFGQQKKNGGESMVNNQKLFTTGPRTVVWLKDNFPVKSKLVEDKDFVIVAQRLLLKPHSEAERLEGEYSCNVTFANVGSLVSPSVTVHLAGFKKTRQEHSSHGIVFATPNNVAFVPCVLPESRPPPKKVWFVKDKNSSEIVTEGGSYVSINGLQLSATEGNVDIEGFYTCFAQNILNEVVKEAKPIQLVFDNSSKPFSPIQVIFPKAKQTKLVANSGEDVSFECVMIGIPSPKIVWEKYGGTLPPGRFRQFLGNLHLFNISKDDEGSYVCKPKDDDESNKQRQQMPFVVYSLRIVAPLKVGLTLEKSRDNENAWHLSCNVIGDRSSSLVWYFNGRPLLAERGMQPLDHRFDGGDNPKMSLTLKAPLMDGLYQCLARNPIGYGGDSDSVLVSSITDFDNVDESTSGMEDIDSYYTTYDPFLPQIVEGPENTTTFQDLPVTMVCRVTRENIVIWLKDGNRLNLSERFSLIGSATLEIQKATSIDRGWYTCVASNAKGNASASAFLNVENPPIVSDGSFSDANLDHDDGDYGEEDRLLVTDASDEFTIATTVHPNVAHRKKKLKFHLKAPTLYRASNTSVLLNWDLPSAESLPGKPQIFKVQYKKVKSTNKWLTLDIDLPDYSRSHTVDSLEPGATYKFRVGVVFHNDLQAISRSSPKFTLLPEPQFAMPIFAPVLLKAVPLSPSAIEIQWENPVEETATLEGFIINYRRLYAGASQNSATYQNETVIGGVTQEHVLTHLLPATPYEIRMSAFNAAGRSRTSEAIVQSTLTDEENTTTSDGTIPPLTFLPGMVTTEFPHMAKDSNSSVSRAPSMSQDSTILGLQQETFLLIVGAVLGGILMITIILMIVCALKQRRKEKSGASSSKGKFRDASQRIYREQSSLINDKSSNDLYCSTLNKVLKTNNLPPPPSVTGYASNGTVVNLYSNPLETTGEDCQEIDAADELEASFQDAEFPLKNNIYKNYLDISVSDRSNSTASHRSDRSKSTTTSTKQASTTTADALHVRSPFLAPPTALDSTQSQYLWTRGSSPKAAERRSWNFSSSPPSSVIDGLDSSRYDSSTAQDNNKQFYTFKPERSPNHLNNNNYTNYHQMARRLGDAKARSSSDGYHSDA